MIEFLLAHGLELALGLTVILTVGAAATARSRGPVQRHAIVRLTFAASWLGLVLLALPLPRPARISVGRPVLLQPERVAEIARAETPHSLGPAITPPPVVELAGAAPVVAADSVPAPTAEQHRPTAANAPRAPAAASSTEPLSPKPGVATIDLGPWIARAYLAAALGLLLHFLVCAAVLRRTLRRATTPSAALATRLQGWIDESCTRARVLVSADAARPFCCGVRRATIVLPAHLAEASQTDGLESVVRHELAHLARRDPAARLVAALSAPLLFWNPLYWWLASELRRSAELLADDAAASSIDKRRYVAELLSLAERSTSSFPVLVPNVLGPRRDFLMRMETLLMRSHRLPTSTSRRHVFSRTLGAALVLVTVSVALGAAPQEGGSDPPTPSEIPALNSLYPVRPPTTWTYLHEFVPSIVLEVDLRTNAARVVPTAKTVPIKIEVDDAAALGLFLYLSADADLTLGALDLNSSATSRRSVRFEVETAAIKQITALVRRCPGVRMTPEDAFVLTSVSSVLNAAATRINGQVVDVRQQEGGSVVRIDCGQSSGVTVGTNFEVYNRGTYKGQIKVIAVEAEHCMARFVHRVQGQPVESGDSVTTDL